jgi:hypothetical protein
VPSSPPPYAPGFGKVPPVPVGRDELLDLHERRLLHGPGDPNYTWALIGERGVGKTVCLTLLGNRMRERGWAVLDYAALTRADPIADLLALLADTVGKHWRGRTSRALQRELTVGLNAAVVKVQGRVASSPDSPALSPVIALQHALAQIGERAARTNVGLLITVDEAQALGDNLQALAAVMQMVTNRQQHPIAWVLAGTRELSELLLHSGSFPERMPRSELAMLTAEQSRLALMEPANRHGVTWEGPAARLLADAAAGYPYFVQVGGYEAWQAETRETVIGPAAAARAIDAIRTRADRMFGDRWARLGPVQRQYIAAAAVIALDRDPAGISTGEVARLLGRQHRELSMARQALIDEHRLLRAAGQGRLQFSIPLFENWLQQQLASTTAPDFATLLPESAKRPRPQLGPRN